MATGSRRLAAPAKSGAASPARRWSKAICPRSISTRAAASSSSASESTALSSRSAASSAPASRLAPAAATSAWPGAMRRATAWRPARGTPPPPRARREPARGPPSARAPWRPARPVPSTPAARCHARRSGSTCGIGRLGQRRVHRLAHVQRRRPIDRRAHERMEERHALADRQQAFRLVGNRRRGPDAESLGRAPHERRVADRLRRGDQQQQPRLVRERVESPQEALLDPPRQRVRSPGARMRPALASRPAPAAAPGSRAGCHASRRRAGHGRAPRAGPG